MRQVVWLLGNHPWEAGTKRQYRDRHKNKWSPLLILIIMHGQDGERRHGKHSLRKRMPPCEGEKLFLWPESYESNADSRIWKTCRMNESDADKKIDACSQKLAVLDVSWNSRWCTGKWVPTPPTCVHQCLTQMKSETASSPMSQQLIQLTSETASFWVLPPILRQDLSSTSETASSFRTPPLHPPAAATSNLLRVTKNFCYGSYLNGSTLSVNSDTE